MHGIYHSNTRGRILNNIVYRTQGWGIHTWHAATAVTIANNLVFQNVSGGIVVSANAAVADNFVVANNTVIDNGWGIIEFREIGQNNRYLNNLVFGNTRADFRLLNGNVNVGTVTGDPR